MTMSVELWDGYLYDSYGRLEYYQSETRDSETDYVYEGNSVTIIENGKSVTKSYDLFGNLVSVKDTAGTVTYNLAPGFCRCPRQCHNRLRIRQVQAAHKYGRSEHRHNLI